MKAFWTLPLLGFALAACTGGPSDFQTAIQDDHQDAQILGGKIATSADEISKSVVAIRFTHPDGSREVCSGSLIHNQLVLTAAHCAKGFKDTLEIYFTTDFNNVNESDTWSVVDMSIPNEYIKDDPAFPKGSPYDIAILKLDRKAPSWAKSFLLAADGTDLNQLTKVSVAGFGATAFPKATKQSVGMERVLRYANKVPVAAVLNDFLVWELDQTGGKGMCVSDSGGPAYIMQPEGPLLLGSLIYVYSPKSNPDYCTGTSRLTQLPMWGPWIREQKDLLLQD